MDTYVFSQRGFLFMFGWSVLRLDSKWPSIDGAAASSIDGGSSEHFFEGKKLLDPFMEMISAMFSLDMLRMRPSIALVGLMDPWKYQIHPELDKPNLYYFNLYLKILFSIIVDL